jgi:LPS-assembly protein
VPYYWNIAPNRDATLAPRIITRRGPGLDGEFRYLEPDYGGTLQLNWLPHDRLAGRSRNAVGWLHEGRLGAGFEYRADLARVSDPAWWKDFPDSNRGFTPRLLPLHAGRGAALRVRRRAGPGLCAGHALAGAAGQRVLHHGALRAQPAGWVTRVGGDQAGWEVRVGG